MNRIFIIAHAPLASALRASALHVFPDAAAHIAALDVQPNVPREETQASAEILMQELSVHQRSATKKSNILVLTDIFGATPCNVAQGLVDGIHSQLIAGVNLPMLVRAMTYRQESLDVLVSRAVTGGIQGVMAVAITAPQHQKLKRHDQNKYDHQQ